MKELIARKKVEVRFSEVDSMGIVWHGAYLKYFEDGREAFGKIFHLGYMEMYAQGFYVPLVELDLHYKRPLNYPQTIFIDTVYVPCDAAKIKFEYKIYDIDNKIITVGNSTQVFLDKQYNLMLNAPDFYIKWKEKYL
jgi:acyl-CoA thioester hydrolase